MGLHGLYRDNFTFTFYYLRNKFCKATTIIDSDSSDTSGQSKFKTFWKGFAILNAIRNIRDSWKEVKISTLRGVCKKLIPTLTDDFEGLKTSVKESSRCASCCVSQQHM
jgi:hypothetical protein